MHFPEDDDAAIFARTYAKTWQYKVSAIRTTLSEIYKALNNYKYSI
jgi:hypothetical protein